MGRLTKYIGARGTASDESKVLLAVPFGPGEKIATVTLSSYFASGAASAIDQPGEINWYGITIPWSIVWATNLLAAGTPGILDGVPAIDKLFVQWLKDVNDNEAGERFGGDANDDVETVTGEEGHASGSEELIESGPIGVQKWFSREVIMTPLAAEGNTTIRFGDMFSAIVKDLPGAAMGGLMLFGVSRFDPAANTEFNVELDDATSKEMMGLLIGGDYTKIKAKVEGDTSTAGDYLRTILFGGDNFIEADTLKGPIGKSIVKATVWIDSPISRHQR